MKPTAMPQRKAPSDPARPSFVVNQELRLEARSVGDNLQQRRKRSLAVHPQTGIGRYGIEVDLSGTGRRRISGSDCQERRAPVWRPEKRGAEDGCSNRPIIYRCCDLFLAGIRRFRARSPSMLDGLRLKPLSRMDGRRLGRGARHCCVSQKSAGVDLEESEVSASPAAQHHPVGVPVGEQVRGERND